jgi:hypothetical protein
MRQTKLTDFKDNNEVQLLARESELTAGDDGRQLDLFNSKVGVANVTKTNST